MNEISINNFDRLCRTCSQSNDLISIQKNIYLIEMLSASAQIQMQLNDELPKNICLKCVKELNQSYAFISKCKTTDAAFRQCLTREKLLNPAENAENFISKLEMTEEIFIKPEISDIDDSASDEISKDSSRQQSECNIENKSESTVPETDDNHLTDVCSNCNRSFATNAEFISHNCQFILNEPMQPEGDCNFEFHDMSVDDARTNFTSHISDNFKNAPKLVDLSSLPKRSQKIYGETYRRFMDYCKTNGIASLSEHVLVSYFKVLSTKMKSSTLWATYSMLKATLNVKHNLDLAKHVKLRAFLKHQADGYQPKISKVLEKEQIVKFLAEAPDDTHLTTKVALVLGVAGACRCEELLRMKVDDIKDIGSKLLLTIAATKSRKTRSVVISECLHLDIYRRYVALRPIDLNSTRFFFKYSNGRASKQLIGIHKFGSMPQEIAAYLKLPDVKGYTGHCFRRTSTARELWG